MPNFPKLLVGPCQKTMSRPLEVPLVEELTSCQNPLDFKRCVGTSLREVERLLKEILEVRSKRNRENTLVPYNRLMLDLGSLSNAISCLRSVHPAEEIRRAAEESEKEVARLATSLSLNQELYQGIRQCDPLTLDAKGKRLLKHLLRDFHRAGVDRDDATREQVCVLRDKIVATGQEFLRNIVKDVRLIELEGLEELEGLPVDYVREHAPQPNGKIRITTDSPDYNPFMTYATSDTRRRELYTEFRRRGFPDNLEVLRLLMTQRHQLATLLGYSSWASYVAEDKMIQTPEAIGEFIERVSRVSQTRARREYDELLSQKRKLDPGATEVHDWEKTWLEGSIRSEKHQFDFRAVRTYFEYGRVKTGVLSLVEDLFGVRFEPDLNAIHWHPDVEVYNVLEGGCRVGRIYLDMHPREGKFKHAALFPLVRGARNLAVPEAALVCNFPNPRLAQGPALLDHDEVLTLLHEFGHLLHQLFAREEEWSRFNGISNEWDFIEVPSQLFEEWGWEYDALKRFAIHHETGETIPRDLVERLRRAKAFGRSLAVRHQMFYASLSLECFGPEAPDLDTTRVVEECQGRHSLFRFVPGTYFQASFGHLNDYSALYYTYMWSLVIEKDICVHWRKSGLMSREAAARYRDCILRPGGSLDAADLVRSFLGRDYVFKAFEEWLEVV